MYLPLPPSASEAKPVDQVTDADKKATSTCKGFPVGPRAAALEKWLKSDDSKVCSHVLLAGWWQQAKAKQNRTKKKRGGKKEKKEEEKGKRKRRRREQATIINE